MIRRFFCALTACALLFSGACASPDMRGMIRLHVVAADDTEEMQALKLELRDVCLKCAEACLYGAADADEAYLLLNEHLDDFEAACKQRAYQLGYDEAILAETGCFEFPTRMYGALRVPAGSYRALRVTIGSGKGHNWWCVLYPSLCKLNEADAGGTPDARTILDWIRERLGWK